VAVGISLLSCLQTEIYVLQDYMTLLGFPTSGNLLTSDYHQYTIWEMSVAEIMGVAVGSLFQSSVELKISYMFYAVHKLSYPRPLENTTLDYTHYLHVSCTRNLISATAPLNLYQSQLGRLQLIQNDTAQAVSETPKFCCISPV